MALARTSRRDRASALKGSLDMKGILVMLSELDLDDDHYPVRAAELADALEIRLADPVLLREAAEAVSRVAHDLGCSTLAGASPAGDRLAAASAVTDGTLMLVTQATTPGRVLLVDTVVVTGFALMRAAEEVRALGAERVYGCVLGTALSLNFEGVLEELKVAALAS